MHLYLRRILIRDAHTQSILCGVDLAVTQRDRDLTTSEVAFVLEVAAIFVMAMNRPREVGALRHRDRRGVAGDGQARPPYVGPLRRGRAVCFAWGCARAHPCVWGGIRPPPFGPLSGLDASLLGGET